MAGQQEARLTGSNRDPSDPENFLNRELSWIEFDRRVLGAALDPSTPLLERLKFLAISATNLDEFFMVRVAGLKQQVANHVEERGPDGLVPGAQLREIARRVHDLVGRQYSVLETALVPGLRLAGIDLVPPGAFTPEDRSAAERFFRDQIFPVLTPLAVDPGHPFPNLRNRSLNLAVRFRRRRQGMSIGVVQVPSVLGRFVPLPSQRADRRLAWLEDVIALHVGTLFGGTDLEVCAPFRVTRNWDLNFDEEDADDLLKAIEKEVRRRDKGNAVRLEIDERADDAMRATLAEALRLSGDDVYRIRGPLHLGDLMEVYRSHEGTESGGGIKDEPLVPVVPAPIRESHKIIPPIGRSDLLLHHPYESFDPVVDFVEEAADDPDVLAIKQTLYRTSGDSPIIHALARAAENRKQVTAIVELKARFDEENNIAWARALEAAGVHVVYGLIGLKTHCKMSLVVRREGEGIRRYLHLSTGNYNPATARVYTDISLFTARPDFCADASELFNLLTGNTSVGAWRRFAVAPFDLHERVIALIDRVTAAAEAGKPARICAKMNALVDPAVIRALYRASNAGATVELLVRGICCLRPGVPGLSANIRVRSVVDRFLEHSRILHTVAGDDEQVWLSSSDWMPRNFIRRVEVMFPVEDPVLRRRLVDEVLGVTSSENARSQELGPDGEYHPFPPEPASGAYRPQLRFLELAREQAKPATLRAQGPVPAGQGRTASGGGRTGR